jgi:hypothetical protein
LTITIPLAPGGKQSRFGVNCVQNVEIKKVIANSRRMKALRKYES